MIVGAAAALAAGGTVALARDHLLRRGGTRRRLKTPLAGAPPLVLDLGVRVDPRGQGAQAGGASPSDASAAPRPQRIFERYDSPEAQVGAAVARLAGREPGRRSSSSQRSDPRNSLVLLHLGYANLWAGKEDDATAAWRRAEQAQPDSASAQRADTALHPDFPSGQPFFVPSFRPPPGLARLAPPAQLAALEQNARRQDVHAKLLYGLALQRLGHRISARRQYDGAARLAPHDADAQVAAAIGRFDKSRPSEAFSRLGPLTRRFPQAATVRFHLGLLLLWLARNQPGSVDEAKRQLRLAQQEEPGSPLARKQSACSPV